MRTRRALVTLALVASAGGWPHAAELLDRVLAVVSGSVITLSDARAVTAFGLVETGGAPDPMAAAVRWLVDRQLVLDEVNRYEAVEPAAALLDAKLAEIKRRFGNEIAYAAALGRFGLDESGVRVLVRDTIRVQQHLDRRFESALPVTDQDLREHYAAQPGRFVRDGRPLAFDEARELVEASLQADRRAKAVEAWLARLRRRADLSGLYLLNR